MINQNQLNAYIKYFEAFRNNVVRSMAIRIKLHQQRLQAIELLKKNHQDQNGIKILRRCIKNERWFLKIIEDGLNKSFGPLKEAYSFIKSDIDNKEMINNIKRFIQIIEIYYTNIEKINKRLELEEKFIEEQDIDLFQEYLEKMKEEIDIHRSLIKQTVDVTKLERYFKKLYIQFRLLRQKTANYIPLGITIATVASSVKVFINSTFKGEKTDINSMIANISLSFAIITFLWILAEIFANINEAENRIERINNIKILKAKKSLF